MHEMRWNTLWKKKGALIIYLWWKGRGEREGKEERKDRVNTCLRSATKNMNRRSMRERKRKER
jgi:hypothetical protein